MALWRQRGLILKEEEARVPEWRARILWLRRRAHRGVAVCLLVVVVETRINDGFVFGGMVSAVHLDRGR